MDPERKVILDVISDVLISDVAGIVLSYIPLAKVQTLLVSPNDNPVCNTCFGPCLLGPPDQHISPSNCFFCRKREVKLHTVLSLYVDKKELEIFRFHSCQNCSFLSENVRLHVALPCMDREYAIWDYQWSKRPPWPWNIARKRALSCCDAPSKRPIIAFCRGPGRIALSVERWILCCETHFAHLESILSLLPVGMCYCGMC